MFRAWSIAAAKNAVSLAEEARLLMDAGRLPRAYYLAHMSIEESAKSLILHAAAVTGTSPDQAAKVGRLLRDHKKKIGLVVDWAETSSPALAERLAGQRDALVDHINDLKNDTMYVSCSRGVLTTPQDRIDSEKAQRNVLLAELLAAQMSRWVEA